MINQKNAVVYTRVSTNMQVDGFSLDGQLEEIKEYCKRNNLNIIGEYKDEGMSGTSIKNRTDLQKMLNDISKDKNIDTVVVWKLSRLSRNMADLATTVEFFEKYNVNLICITQGIDTSNPMGENFVYMAGMFAKMERDNIIETCKMGMKQRALEGGWNGGKVFGYRSKYYEDENKKKNSKLEIVEEEAVVIKEIFKLFVNEKWGYSKIANQLNDRGLRTIENNYWSKQCIKTIIDNPVYVGKIRWGVHLYWSKQRRQGKQENPIISDGKHDFIIDEETWEKAQRIRSVTGKISEKTYEGNYLLSGLIKCPVCGASMVSHRTVKKGKSGENITYRYYQCLNYVSRGSNACKSNLVNADKAELEVLSRINEIVKSKKIIEAIINKMEKESYIDTTDLENQLKELKKELKKAEDGRKEHLQLRYDKVIDIKTLDEMLKYFDQKESETNNTINSIQNQLNNIHNKVKVEPARVKAILENFTQIFEKADIAKKKVLLKSIIESIAVINGKSSRDRNVDKIKLYFEPEDVQVLSPKKFANTTDTVNRITNKG